MLARLLDGERRAGLRDESDEALTDGELDAPDRFGGEPLGRAQREALALGLRQVDRAHVGIETLGDPIDDVAQGLREVVRTRDDPGDVCEQCAALGNGCAPFRDPRPSMYPTAGVPSGGRADLVWNQEKCGGAWGGRIISPDAISDVGGKT